MTSTLTHEEYDLLCIASQVLDIPFLELEVDGATVKHPKTGMEWPTEWKEGKGE